MLYCYREGEHTYMRAEESRTGPMRVVLRPSQWSLIRENHGFRPIEVCSVNHVIDCKDPNQVLARMSDLLVPHVSGGWRALDDAEICALYISRINPVEEMQQQPLRSQIVRGLAGHPLIASGVSFAYGGAITLPLVILMQDIFDILRFNEFTNPLRRRKLKSYFGLQDISAINRLRDNPTPSTIHDMRTQLVVQAWNQQPHRKHISRDEIMAQPDAFIFRDYQAYYEEALKSHSADRAVTFAVWKTTLRFVTFIRHLWLGGLKIDPFKPERFFSRPDEIEAFTGYLKARESV